MKRDLFLHLAGTAAICCATQAFAANVTPPAPLSSGNSTAGSAVLAPGVVAVVNGTPITQDQLDVATRAMNLPDSPALRANVKKQLIARELFVQAAQAAHYDTHADVRNAVEQAKDLAMSQAYLRDTIKPASVSDADVKAKYDEVVATLGENEFKSSVIVTNDLDTAQKALDQLKNHGDFAQLAKQYSVAPDAAQGGVLNWVSFKLPLQEGKTQGWPLPVADALMKLPVGSVTSSPVAAGGKFYVLRLDEKRATQVPLFETAKPALARQLRQAALQKATADVVIGLVKSAKIQE
jgi:parvulin-like peptidyl-prolyl isomerase